MTKIWKNQSGGGTPSSNRGKGDKSNAKTTDIWVNQEFFESLSMQFDPYRDGKGMRSILILKYTKWPKLVSRS